VLAAPDAAAVAGLVLQAAAVREVCHRNRSTGGWRRLPRAWPVRMSGGWPGTIAGPVFFNINRRLDAVEPGLPASMCRDLRSSLDQHHNVDTAAIGHVQNPPLPGDFTEAVGHVSLTGVSNVMVLIE